MIRPPTCQGPCLKPNKKSVLNTFLRINELEIKGDRGDNDSLGRYTGDLMVNLNNDSGEVWSLNMSHKMHHQKFVGQ